VPQKGNVSLEELLDMLDELDEEDMDDEEGCDDEKDTDDDEIPYQYGGFAAISLLAW
jgi:hypothetical protein